MSQEPSSQPRRGAAVAVATASLTLAAGVTVAALLGYLHPVRRPEPASPATVAAPAAPAASPERQVVLVPVRPGADSRPEPEVAQAAPRRGEHDEGSERGEHSEHRRGHQRHEDDDDED